MSWITSRCDKCGQVRITKVKMDPKHHGVLQWYYWCETCGTREIFNEEPLEDDLNDNI